MAGPESGVARRATSDLNRLRWLSVALPILFLVGIEAFRFIVVESDPVHQAEHVAVAAIGAVAIVGFSVFMFRMIERAEAQVLRQNRELTAINAVSTAVQGELAVEQIIDAALSVVIERTHATEASVTVFTRDNAGNAGLERRVVRGPHGAIQVVSADPPHLVDIPLTRGASIVGRMRIHLDQGGLEPDLLTSSTLNNIGHQLACAIEIGQLVGDLRRRRQEGDALYEVLLRISSQKPLAETLDAVMRHARELLNVDRAQLNVRPTCAGLLAGAPADLAAACAGLAGSHNLVVSQSAPACFADGVNGNIVGQDPLLGALRNNGGPTRTHALLTGSPAIDAGDTTLETDQRGFDRPSGPADDIGAFEVTNAQYERFDAARNASRTPARASPATS